MKAQIIGLAVTALASNAALGQAASASEEDQRDGASSQRPYEITEVREPCADYEPLRRPHFGDTHVHTAWSFDASTQDTRNKPIDAYNFAS